MTRVADLVDHFRLACENAAIASDVWRGKGDGKAADGAAVEAMRATFDQVPFDGRVAIGEGERDEAPMLWIGEPLGNMHLYLWTNTGPRERSFHMTRKAVVSG